MRSNQNPPILRWDHTGTGKILLMGSWRGNEVSKLGQDTSWSPKDTSKGCVSWHGLKEAVDSNIITREYLPRVRETPGMRWREMFTYPPITTTTHTQSARRLRKHENKFLLYQGQCEEGCAVHMMFKAFICIHYNVSIIVLAFQSLLPSYFLLVLFSSKHKNIWYAW